MVRQWKGVYQLCQGGFGMSKATLRMASPRLWQFLLVANLPRPGVQECCVECRHVFIRPEVHGVCVVLEVFRCRARELEFWRRITPPCLARVCFSTMGFGAYSHQPWLGQRARAAERRRWALATAYFAATLCPSVAVDQPPQPCGLAPRGDGFGQRLRNRWGLVHIWLS